VKNFKHLNDDQAIRTIFIAAQRDSLYIHLVRQLNKIYIGGGSPTGLAHFDEHLISILNDLARELNRYTAFKTILKGYEALIHYTVAYYCIQEDVGLSYLREHISGEKKHKNEMGSLGAWLEFIYFVLKSNGKLEGSLLNEHINEDIFYTYWKFDRLRKRVGSADSEAFINYLKKQFRDTNSEDFTNYLKEQFVNCLEEQYKGINQKELFNIKKKLDNNPEKLYGRYYDLLSNKLVNLRNNTIGHGSSNYVPSDAELWLLLRLYLSILNSISQKLSALKLSRNQIWILQDANSDIFLDKVSLVDCNLSYKDYYWKRILPPCSFEKVPLDV